MSEMLDGTGMGAARGMGQQGYGMQGYGMQGYGMQVWGAARQPVVGS